MKKKLALTAAAVALVGTLAVGGTLAWFTDTEEATNVVTIGDVDILWNEGNQDITGNTKGLQLGSEDTPIVPGVKLQKDAYVKNVGKNDAYIRAKVTYKVNGVEKGHKVKDIPDGYTVTFAQDTNWEFNPVDEYYYYKGRVVAKTGVTDELIDFVSIQNIATEGQIADTKFEVILNAEAIQADNTSPANPTTVAQYASIFKTGEVDGKIENEADGQGN